MSNNKKLVLGLIIGIIVGGLIFSGVTYYLMEQSYNKQPNIENGAQKDNNEENKNEEKPSDKEENEITKAEKLLEYFGFNEDIACFGKKIYSSSYDEIFKISQAIRNVEQSKVKTMKCSNIYSDDKLGSNGAYQLEYGNCFKVKETTVVSYDDVNEVYKKMYGTDVKKQGVRQNSCEWASSPYDYNQDLNSFVQLSGSGCGGICSNHYVLVNKIKSVKYLEDSLLIEVYYFNTLCDYDSIHKQFSCKVQTPNINELITANDRESVEKEILNKYLDKLDVYEVQFQLNGNDYIFKNVIKK